MYPPYLPKAPPSGREASHLIRLFELGVNGKVERVADGSRGVMGSGI